MSLPAVLAMSYASMIEDISPPWPRASARKEIDAILDGPVVPDPETWGEDPAALADAAAAEATFGRGQ